MDRDPVPSSKFRVSGSELVGSNKFSPYQRKNSELRTRNSELGTPDLRFLWFFLIVILAGCHRQTPEQRAERDAREGRYQSAISHYEESLAQGDRVQIHLKMADLFATRLRDSASAIYHYRRVLALRPSGREAELARGQIKALASGYFAENGAASAKPIAPKASAAALAAAEAERQARTRVHTYVVQSGDTLVSISRKFYQTPNRWKDILDTNKYQVTNPDELKAGQTIILP